ncbi:MAG: hypothetical protein IPK93_03955 [Solirubrobacterales bacterium]|nr:hypothetical protein [Solirubrobacterales bacterium]
MPACLAVLVAALILLTIYGTDVGDSLLYFGYLCGWVYLPGWLVYRVLADEPGSGIRQFAIGAGLGYILGVFAFMFTAAIDFRTLLDFYPLIIGIPALLILLFRYRGGLPKPEPAAPSRLIWGIAAVCILAMASIAIAFFAVTPLPGTRVTNYSQDFSWAISLVVEALHHWPLTEPSEVGEPVPYHNFVHLSMASASQITGIDAPLIFFRLSILPIVALTVVQLVAAGRSLFGSATGGLIAAALTYLVGDWGLASGGTLFSFLFYSPSFLFGLLVLIPLFILIGWRLRLGSLSASPGEWVLLALFAAAAGGAKVTILPLLIGSLAIFGLISWFKARRFPWAVLGIGLILSAAQLAYYFLLYRGHTTGLSIRLNSGIDFLRGQSYLDLVKDEILDLLPGLPLLDGILTVFAIAIALFALIGAPLVGLYWFLGRRNRPLSPIAVWFCALLGVGLFFLAFVQAVGTGNQLYFLYYGVLAGILMSGVGLREAFSEGQPILEHQRTILILLGLWAVAIAGYIVLPGEIEPGNLARGLLVGYGILVGGMVLLWLAARHFLRGVGGGVAVVLALAFIMVGMIDMPRAFLDPSLSSRSEPTEGYRMTPDLYGGLRWLKNNTPEDTAVIVNNQRGESATGYTNAYDYAAFSERHYFLAGWGYSLATRDAGYDRVLAGFNPFADRQALNDRAFAGDEAAIEKLKSEYGVEYAVVDGINGDPDDLAKLKPFGTVVYQETGVAVLRFD